MFFTDSCVVDEFAASFIMRITARRENLAHFRYATLVGHFAEAATVINSTRSNVILSRKNKTVPLLYTDAFSTRMCHGFFPCLSHSSASLPSSASRSVASANLSQFLRNPLPGKTRLEQGRRGRWKMRSAW